MKLSIRNPASDHEDMEFDVHLGDKISIETSPGKGVTVTVAADGTLRIDVDTTPGEEPCLTVVPD